MFRQLIRGGLLTAASVGLMGTAEAVEIEVTITKLAFAPVEITVAPGDTIKWVNQDFVAHTATDRAKVFDVMIPAHGAGTLFVETAGTIDYFCRFHPMMKGRIQVGGN
jgi:plastocyanin